MQVSKEGDDDPLSALTGGGGGGNDDGGNGGRHGPRGHSRGGSGGGSCGTGGAWRRYYEGLELIEEIRRDLTRLYPRWVGIVGGWVGGAVHAHC